MSDSEIRRFLADLEKDENLHAALHKEASGVASIIAFAKAHGYDIDADDVRSHIQSQAGKELSDAELDAVAGGTGATTTQVVEANVIVVTLNEGGGGSGPIDPTKVLVVVS